MDAIDRAIVNNLQDGFPICECPYRQVAEALGISEQQLIRRLQRMLEDRRLTRFGPLYNAERLGGALSLCAMRVPAAAFERVAEQVNAFPEVAHNYAREHAFNMWFVLATETPARLDEVVREIATATGCPVLNLPKREEFFIGLKFEV